MWSICRVWAPGRPPQTRKRRQTMQNQWFWRQNEPLPLKIQILISKFEFQASCCITNLKHHIYGAPAEYGRRGGPQTRKRRKQCKTVFLAPNEPLQLKIQIFEFKFECQASCCITNFKHCIYEASSECGRRQGFHGRENVEKQCKTVQNSVLAPNRPLQPKIQFA